MNKILLIICLIFLFHSCEKENNVTSFNEVKEYKGIVEYAEQRKVLVFFNNDHKEFTVKGELLYIGDSVIIVENLITNELFLKE